VARRPPAAAVPTAGHDQPAPYIVGVAWGILWRYAVVASITLAIFSGLRPPIAALAVSFGVGAVLGLWFRTWWLAAAWRAVVLGWAAGTASSYWFFPYTVAGALLVVTIEPWLTTRKRHSRRTKVSGIPAAPARALSSGTEPAEGPAPLWPRATRGHGGRIRRARAGRAGRSARPSRRP